MSRVSLVTLCLLPMLLLAACQQEREAAAPAPAPAQPTTTQAAAGTQPQILDGFSTPESVLYDAEQDVYFVSNINGSPVEADDNGFVSRISAETLQIEPKWIDGSKPEVQLSAPKGMAIAGDDLYVSDLNVIRRFDRRTGVPKGEVRVPGATFLNDLAAGGDSVYFSDSGMKLEGGNFAGTGTDAVGRVRGNRAEKLAATRDLNRPNGVAVVGEEVWAVTFGGNELYRISGNKKTHVTTLPQGSLDGLIALPDGTLLVSSWDGKTVYRGKPGQPFTAAVENLESPADIGYDTKRNRLLVPHFTENRLSIHSLQ